MSRVEEKARQYLLNEHSSPLTPIMHQADIKAEMQYHKDIENAFIAGANWREKEPANEDLEQAAKNDSDDELYAIHFEKWNITGECPSELEAKIDAKFGITGRDSNGKPSNGYCDWKKDVFTNGPSIYSFVKLGMDYQKEQMMKDAIVGRVTGIGPLTNGNVTDTDKKTRRLSATYSFENTPYCELDDKVKVIIIKE